MTEIRYQGRLSSRETSLKWLTIAMPLLDIRERLEVDRLERETSKILARDKQEIRDGAMADGLT